MVECQSCGGRYEPFQSDGTQYFHRCPPLSAVELAAAVAEGRVKLPKGETADDAIARRVYERADLRDENVPSTKTSAAGAVIAEGAGVADVLSTTPAVVMVPSA